jgi:hypothetical protein
MPHRAAVLVQQRDHEVNRLDELVIAPDRQTLGIRQRHLELAGQLVHPHANLSPLFFKVIRKSGGKRREIKERVDTQDSAARRCAGAQLSNGDMRMLQRAEACSRTAISEGY